MQKHISNAIKIRGFIPLDEFIYATLCHPSLGYYAKQNPIKRDFITSPEITNAFGIIIANFIFNKLINNPDIENSQTIHFVELGGGSGKLAHDIISFVINLEKLNNPKINKIIQKINFHSIEFSDKLKLIQKNTLESILIKKHFWNNIYEFSTYINNYEQSQNNYFVFYSNEFFDALPIKQFSFDGNNFTEIIITEKNNNFIYEQIKINSEKIDLIPKEIKLNKNDILEIPIMGLKILQEITKIMKKSQSIFLTFDYGYFQCPHTSTLQGIYHGKKITNILEYAGDADITHLVNFTLFAEAFRTAGIKTHMQTQKEFLIENGISSLLKEDNKHGIDRITYQMGDLFKVLTAES